MDNTSFGIRVEILRPARRGCVAAAPPSLMVWVLVPALYMLGAEPTTERPHAPATTRSSTSLLAFCAGFCAYRRYLSHVAVEDREVQFLLRRGSREEARETLAGCGSGPFLCVAVYFVDALCDRGVSLPVE